MKICKKLNDNSTLKSEPRWIPEYKWSNLPD